MADVAVVVTSISAPNKFLQALADGCRREGYSLTVVGDAASPPDFQLEGCRFYSLRDQETLGFKLAKVCPERHYARKNLGYLIAARDGVKQIIETDDDNLPYETFWPRRRDEHSAATLSGAGWVNVYRYFSEANIWPRGFPLDHLKDNPPAFQTLSQTNVYCPIQQGLADNDADVDAIYRLTSPLPVSFLKERRIALMCGSWCPFNSQNTTWSQDAFPLLYLPAFCSFRMTDIWRSFVAQRIAWTNGWGILFHEPTVWQERNQHDLLKDFKEEVPGYLHNGELCAALEKLELRSGIENLPDNLRICYEKMVSLKLLPARELTLLDAWLADLGQIIGTSTLKLPFRATGN
jgi:STELLO glycosyltransferase-like protein